MTTADTSQSKQTFQYGDKIIEYTVILSKRRKTCEIIVDKNEVILTVPYDKPSKEIEGILQDKIKWIATKQKEFQRVESEIIKPSFKNKSTLPYLGNNHELIIVFDNYQKEKIDLVNNQFIVYLQNEKIDQKQHIKTLYTDWLNFEANKVFINKVEKYSKIVNVCPKKIILKNLKNRWGSVTRNGIINLNINLIKAPEEIIDYVIIHELCHIKIKGHSYQFWNYLKQFVRDYIKCIKWLEKNTPNLL